MGLDRRKTSGRIFGGANLIVPDQPIYSVKNFPPTFQYKRGTPKDTFREIPQPSQPPAPTPTPTPVVDTFYILTELQEVILTESGENIIY
jgi:hypothetical protein